LKADQTITKEIDLSKNWDITKKKGVIKPNSMVHVYVMLDIDD
jgi:hypothetical protein